MMSIKTYLSIYNSISKNNDTIFRFLLLWNFVLSFIVAHAQLYFFKQKIHEIDLEANNKLPLVNLTKESLVTVLTKREEMS